MQKRKLDIVVISDVHLGIYSSHAEYLLSYLKSIECNTLVLNGDIIDLWNFSKLKKTHVQVIRAILKMAQKNTKVVYITGNHDDALRKYSGTNMGNIILEDKLILDLNGEKTWIFHGDVFDHSTRGWAKTIAKLGGKGYDYLIWNNRMINKMLQFFNRPPVSFSKKVKESVKNAVKWIADFELTAAELAAEHGFSTVICGHIHQPQSRIIETEKGPITYLNSGDWVENCTALEYQNNKWELYTHQTAAQQDAEEEEEWKVLDNPAAIVERIVDFQSL
jgi:UDP-2,3-diacylglucosamine pyrophosphatase LpxH